ncbi:hypothetical protein L21SP3_02230 [Sedimentisphaera cyanobacteriorum]|uniref:DUF5060 domain-containing protein n=1 Tax=Sedimentisphaera cyanobacteriorum TaxID=1940790 RepID=A0A1Q2HSH3_9BACT|nr:DUF5060 domain-containing protein [Sedimentisphaera cyanobacteriorum]AQQ10398.1 hypothetical protein L21SP3_02230 [Sedimentisphaera cyanobacteriorum]
MLCTGKFRLSPIAFLLICGFVSASPELAGPFDSPERLIQWHKITLTLEGPQASENGTPNPFTDYRMYVVFKHEKSGLKYRVPGYFAADGDSANSSAQNGNKWCAHLCPDKHGKWTYEISFRKGKNAAVSEKLEAGKPLAPYHGISGRFKVVPSDKSGRDFRGKGRLEYVGKTFLKFAGSGEYFIKQGTDAPENFLAYEDFDGNFKTDGRKDHLVKSWSAHAKDWDSGDPYWQDKKGTEIIGAINYLAGEGLNAFSFIPMNIKGDDRNVFPYTDYNERFRMDCSKLAQWEIVFEYADKKGMFLHFKTQETENELLLDGGDLGKQRKLYYRELIARFSHHLAINWNLGEEVNNASTSQKKSWAEYFFQNDPYHHHIVIHNMGNPHHDLMGEGSRLTGMSVQTNKPDFRNVYPRVKSYIQKAKKAGKVWAVACDEPGDAQHALRPDNDAGNSHDDARRNAIWGTFMAGGWGNEWYFGYKHAHSDLTCEDFRSRDAFWNCCRIALDFFKGENRSGRMALPVENMQCREDLVSKPNRCLYGKDNEGRNCLVVQALTEKEFAVKAPSEKLYKAGWLNSKTGEWKILSDIEKHKGGMLKFKSPWGIDGILLLYDWSRRFPQKE